MSSHLTVCVDKLLQKFPRSGLFICGDFNMHMKANYPMKTCHLSQLVITKPTHIMSIIDLCYTNMNDFYLPPHHEPEIGISKHQVVICSPCSTGFKPLQQTYITKWSQRSMSGLLSFGQSKHWTGPFCSPC